MLSLWQWAAASCCTVLVVLALRQLLRRHLPPRLVYALWLLAAVRLIAPWALPADSPYSAAALAFEPPAAVEQVLLPAGAAEGEPSEGAEGGLTLGQVLTGVWLAGAAAVLGGTALCNLSFARRLRRTRRPFPAPDCPLPVYTAPGLASPCLAGLIRPAIYLTPESAELGEEGLAHMLAHEETHFRQGDPWWNLLRCVCLALHWYDPLVWLGAWLSRQDGELACDQGAVKRLGRERRLDYGRTLLALVTKRGAPADLLSCSTSMKAGRRGLRERIQTLSQAPELAAAAVVVLMLALPAAGAFSLMGDGGISSYEDFLAYYQRYTPANVAVKQGDGISGGIGRERLPVKQAWYDLLSGGREVWAWEDGDRYSEADQAISFLFSYDGGDMGACLAEMEDGCHLAVFPTSALNSNSGSGAPNGRALCVAILPSGTVTQMALAL